MGNGVSMEKIKSGHYKSLKHALYYYFPICAILAYFGTMVIGHGTNYLQGWYAQQHQTEEYVESTEGNIPHASDDTYELYIDETGTAHYVKWVNFKLENLSQRIIYATISYAQVILIPLWVLGCVGVSVWVFYKRELEKPIRVLLEASEKITDNCLDFKLESVKPNELGQLRDGFEKMREALYQNNQKTWRQLEERKRLNAAFTHDLRTPITVLKGYGEMLEKYVPEGRINQEKLVEILGMMNGQIERLENYVRKMSSLQRLEDMEPEQKPVELGALEEKLRAVCHAMRQKDTEESLLEIFCVCRTEGTFLLDEMLILEVCENLIANGVRYARQKLEISVSVKTAEQIRVVEGEDTSEYLEIMVVDDGPGFSPEALQHASDLFYREEGQPDRTHFGLGLYICRVICEKCGGSLTVGNGTSGGRVIAKFLTQSR